jgi:hypothetical protein
MEKQIVNLPIRAIRLFKEKKIIQNGLTIPFIVGIYQQYNHIHPADSSSLEWIRTILDDIVNNQDHQQYLLCRCPDLKEYVLSIPYDTINTGHAICNREGHSILYLAMYDTDIHYDNIDYLAKFLENRYGDHIVNGEFSLKAEQWRSFSKEEIDIINEILSFD